MNKVENLHLKVSVLKNEINHKNNIISFLRLIVFFLFLIEIFRWLLIKSNTIELFMAIILLLSFIILIFLSNKYFNEIEFYGNIKTICEDIRDEEFNKNNTINDNLNPNHPYCFDLDVFGEKSLFQKINICQTYLGKSKLELFLKNNLLEIGYILDRQKAIQELSNKIEWSINFLATAKLANKNRQIETLPPTFNNLNKAKLSTSLVRILLLIIPIINIFFLILFFSLQITLFSSLFLLIPIFLAFVINKIYGKSINEIYSTVNFKSKGLKVYIEVFALIENEKFTSKKNISLQNRLVNNKSTTASVTIKDLVKLIDAYENKNIFIFGGILKILFLWDLLYSSKIEKYIFENKSEIPKWFEASSEFEALICFGLFAYKNSDFVYPICSEYSNIIDTINVSHPLIPKRERVCNNFSTIRNNNVTIITGANMTGKSTFLRSIGINLVLAMNGCPVCAESFSFYPISIFTSMRTKDSLSDGSSYFNAEIQRLKILIEKLENNEPQFIILDEILKGTNSVDKLKGSELFLEKIIKMKTLNTCLIATHDLDLTKMENLYPNNISNYCFELHNNDGSLEPDYKLQRGVTKSMNAIELMRKNHIID